MGNCYYAKGQYSDALTNYQKALNINPNNPQLSNFVESLKAKVGSTPASSVGVPSPGSSPAVGNKFELDFSPGLAVGTSAGTGIGFGGGVEGFVPIDKGLSIGGGAAFYTFSFSYGASESLSGSGSGSVTAGATASSSYDSIEILGMMKYRFEGDKVRPFLVGGVGASLFGFSAGASGGSGSGSSGVSITASGSSTQVDPMISAGGGIEFSAGPNLNIFAQTRLNVIIVLGGASTSISGGGTSGGSSLGTISGSTSAGGGGTFTYLPIEAGLSLSI